MYHKLFFNYCIFYFLYDNFYLTINIFDKIDKGIIPTVNQGKKQECGFLVPKDYYIAVDGCHVNTYGYTCQVYGKIKSCR